MYKYKLLRKRFTNKRTIHECAEMHNKLFQELHTFGFIMNVCFFNTIKISQFISLLKNATFFP